jgi:predicted TIM-barrel fold metal-dependent hydrolase
MLPLQSMDFALEELERVAPMPSFRAVFIRPMFLEGRYLNHPYYDPLWAELERVGIAAAVHATPGLWNPEWTSHGPFFEKIKDRLVQPALPGGGGGPFAGDAMAKLRKSNVPEPLIARMMAQNAADQFGVELSRQRTAVG